MRAAGRRRPRRHQSEHVAAEAASLTIAQDRHDRDLDAEQEGAQSGVFAGQRGEQPEWHPTFNHSTYDPFIED